LRPELIPSKIQTEKITEILGISPETLNKELHQFYEARRKELKKRIEKGNILLIVAIPESWPEELRINLYAVNSLEKSGNKGSEIVWIMILNYIVRNAKNGITAGRL